MLKLLKVAGVNALVFAQLLAVPSLSFASLPGEIEAQNTEIIERKDIEEAKAVVFKGQEPLCEIASAQGNSNLPDSGLPACKEDQVFLAKDLAQNAAFDTRSAFLGVPHALAAGTCFVSGVWGGLAVSLSGLHDDRLERKLDERLARDMQLSVEIGALAGNGFALAKSLVMPRGILVTAAQGFTIVGVSVVCSAAGGAGAYAVKYLIERKRSAN